MDLLIGFSWRGILIAALVLLPNIFFMLLPRTNMSAEQPGSSRYIDILEHSARILYFALIIFTTGKNTISYAGPFIYIALGSLLIYYILWLRYFFSGMDYRYLFDTVLHVPLPMAVFPILFLLASALWLKNIPSVIAALLFAAGHFINSYITYQQLSKELLK
jgi:hypothetical protein